MVAGNSVRFESGKQYRILDAYAGDLGWYVIFDTDDILSEGTCGVIYNCVILNKDNMEVPRYVYVPYESQYGLQGKIMGKISAIFQFENRVKWMSLFCCIAMAIMVLLCGTLLYRKYNKFLAGCFMVVFWLSPWVVNFAKCVYWVEFTWLLPFAVGLMISNWIDNVCVRRCGYFLTFFSVLIKSLCGYKYITFVMLGSVWTLGMDFLLAIYNKDRQKIRKIFRVMVLTGFAALLGFIVALLIHAQLRGNGNIYIGLKSIYENDILRRTLGGDADNFSGNLVVDSINASVLETLTKYFKFTTQIITGIDANLFPLVVVFSLFICIWNLCKKRNCIQDILLYITSFVISVSWFVLGKSHSHVHVHMNYVCWYYWFIPICFYIIKVHPFVKTNFF